jgi:hypothetical protein
LKEAILTYENDDLSKKLANTLTTGKDVTTKKAPEYPIRSPFLKYLADPLKEKIIGYTDPLTNEIVLLKLEKGFEVLQEATLVNEFNHSFVMCGNPQRALLFYGVALEKSITLLKEKFMLDDWREFLESIAIYENLLHPSFKRLPTEIRTLIKNTIQMNKNIAKRIHLINDVINKLLYKNPNLQLNGDDITKLIRVIGLSVAKFPYIIIEEKEIYSSPDFEKIITAFLDLPDEYVPEWRNYKDIEPFIINFFTHLEETIVRSSYLLIQGGSYPTRLEQLPEMLRLDKKGELKPFIYGILHDLNLISPTIFIADENFENQQILLCKIPQDINERIKCAQSFLSALKKESKEVNEKSKQKTLKKCAQIFEKLIFGQEWIRENCQRICIGKVNCPLLASGKVYEVIKRLLCRV